MGKLGEGEGLLGAALWEEKEQGDEERGKCSPAGAAGADRVRGGRQRPGCVLGPMQAEPHGRASLLWPSPRGVPVSAAELVP